MEEIHEFCPECGNRALRRIARNSVQYEECELCGYLSGDEETVKRIYEKQEADEFDIDIAVYPLIKELNKIKGVRTFNSFEGQADARMLPFVDFHIGGHFLKNLSNLVTSLSLSNRETKGFWFIEPFIHTELAFSMKPRIMQDIRHISPKQIKELQNDLSKISNNLQMHSNLSWWRV